MIDLQPVIANLNCSDLHLKLYLAEFSQKMVTLNVFFVVVGGKKCVVSVWACIAACVWQKPIGKKKKKKRYCTSVSLVLKWLENTDTGLTSSAHTATQENICHGLLLKSFWKYSYLVRGSIWSDDCGKHMGKHLYSIQISGESIQVRVRSVTCCVTGSE